MNELCVIFRLKNHLKRWRVTEKKNQNIYLKLHISETF